MKTTEIQKFYINQNHNFLKIPKDLIVSFINLIKHNIKFLNVEKNKTQILRTFSFLFINTDFVQAFLNLQKIFYLNNLQEDIIIKEIMASLQVGCENKYINFLNSFLAHFFVVNQKIYSKIDLINLNDELAMKFKDYFVQNPNFNKLINAIKQDLIAFIENNNLQINKLTLENLFHTCTNQKNTLELLKRIVFRIACIKINLEKTFLLINNFFIKNYSNIFFTINKKQFNFFDCQMYLFLYSDIEINKIKYKRINNLKKQIVKQHIPKKKLLPSYYVLTEILLKILKIHYPASTSFLEILNETNVDKIINIFKTAQNLLFSKYLNNIIIRKNTSLKLLFGNWINVYYSLSSFLTKEKTFLFKCNYNQSHIIISINNSLTNAIHIKRNSKYNHAVIDVFNSLFIKSFLIFIFKNKQSLIENYSYQNIEGHKQSFKKNLEKLNEYFKNDKININLTEKLNNIIVSYGFLFTKRQIIYDSLKIKKYDSSTLKEINKDFVFRLKKNEN